METAVLYCSQIRKEDLVMKHVKSLNTRCVILFTNQEGGPCDETC